MTESNILGTYLTGDDEQLLSVDINTIIHYE